AIGSGLRRLTMLTGLLIISTAVAVQAQTQGSAFTAAAKPVQAVQAPDKKPDGTATDPEKIDVLVKEVREQKEMIDKLFQIVADQQKKLGELSASSATVAAEVHKIDFSDPDA